MEKVPPSKPSTTPPPIGQVPNTKPSNTGSTVVGVVPEIAGVSSKPRTVSLSQLAKRPTTEPQLPAFTISISQDTASPQQASRQDITKKSKITTDNNEILAHTVRMAAGETWQDHTLVDWDPNDFRIFVGDLAPEVTDVMLQQAFAKYGAITKTRVIRDRKSGKSKGYGFVGFKEPDEFLQAIREMNGKYIGSRPIKLRKKNSFLKGKSGEDMVTKNLALEIGVLEAKHFVKKQVQRAAKKARTLGLRKVIKKLKEPAVGEAKKPILEDQMRKLRVLDLVETSKVLFNKKIVEVNEYLRRQLVDFVESSTLDLENVKLIECNTLQQSLEGLAKDLVGFIQNLYHENPIVSSQVDKSARKMSHRRETSVFVNKTKKKTYVSERQIPGRNRKGQKARRAEWERMYGSQARHLQGGEDLVTKDPRPSGSRNKTIAAESLHPSWEARKRQTEMIKAAIKSAPVHKKIKFGDDSNE